MEILYANLIEQTNRLLNLDAVTTKTAHVARKQSHTHRERFLHAAHRSDLNAVWRDDAGFGTQEGFEAFDGQKVIFIAVRAGR